MARLKTRSISTDRHRRIHIQASGQDSAIQNLSELPSEETPRLDDEISIVSLMAEVPPVESVAPKPVSDLALDLVLNEIVLQARLTSNATGAMIALERSRKLACRATTGATSSEIAAFLNIPSGVSITCFETGAVQRVDDLEPGSHADAAAYQRAGVRSILVVPVTNEQDHVLGIIQSFSPRPNAFCDRDVLTLQALARRVATNIELVKKSDPLAATKSSHSLPQASDTSSRRMPRPSRFQFRTPQFLTRTVTREWQAMVANRALMVGKISLALVLIGACVIAGRFWMRSRATDQSPIFHRSSQVPTRQAATQPGNTVPVQIASSVVNTPDKNPFVSMPVASSHQVSSRVRPQRHSASSITIERKPIRKGTTSIVAEKDTAHKMPTTSGEIVLFEDHSGVAQDEKVQPLKSSAKTTAIDAVEAISTQDAMARLVQRVEPEYPNAARQKHIQGDVLLDVVVNESGAVDEMALVSGESQLMPAAEQAVRQWHFQPLIKGGHPKKFQSRIGINFTLASGSTSQGR